jgi:hypothetical protein
VEAPFTSQQGMDMSVTFQPTSVCRVAFAKPNGTHTELLVRPSVIEEGWYGHRALSPNHDTAKPNLPRRPQ